MYGCIYIVGYDEKYCTLENSKGWGWVAAWYFIVFVIVGVMVLVALFIGVIITSMELLHNSIEEESVMLKKVGLKQAEYQMSDGQIATLLEVFEMVDLCLNAKLTINELKPIFGMISLDEARQYKFFHEIDEDASGKIDFAEFLDLIQKIGEAYRSSQPVTRKIGSSDVLNAFTRRGNKKHIKLAMFARTFSRKGVNDEDSPSPPVRRGSSSPALTHRKSIVLGNEGVVAQPLVAAGSPTGADSLKGNAAAMSLLNRRKIVKAKQAVATASEVAAKASDVAPSEENRPVPFSIEAEKLDKKEEIPNKLPILDTSHDAVDQPAVNDIGSTLSQPVSDNKQVHLVIASDMPSCGVSPLSTPEHSGHIRMIHAESSPHDERHANGAALGEKGGELYQSDLEIISAKNPSGRLDDESPKPQSSVDFVEMSNNVPKKRPASGGAARSLFQGSPQRPVVSIQRPKTATPGLGAGSSTRVVPTELHFDYDQDLETPAAWQKQLIKRAPQGATNTFSYDIGSKKSRRSSPNRYRLETRNHSPDGL